MNRETKQPAQANIYLAEDRVMCLELLVKRNSNWILNFLPDCRAMTDPPTTLSVLLQQRRRQLNGSLFAALHCIRDFPRVKLSSHSKCRKSVIYLLFFFFILQIMLSLTLLGASYAAFSFCIRTIFKPDGCGISFIADVFENAYIAIVLVVLLLTTTLKVE